MSGSYELVELICMENGSIAKHLDDTLLNRLETALYCQNEIHKELWDEFYREHFKRFIDNFDQALSEDELSIGKLKLKFAILWQLKNRCNYDDFECIRSILRKLILSGRMRLIAALQKFYEVNLTSNYSFDIYLDDNEICLLELKKITERSANIHHIKSTINLFVLLLRAGIENGDSFEEFCTIMDEASNKDVDFLQDLSTEIIRTSKASHDRTLYKYLTRLSETLVERFRENRQAIQENEGFHLLLMTLAPYNIDITPDYFDPPNPTFGSDLRALISCKMFQPCAAHKHLAKLWFDSVMKFDRNSPEGNDNFASLITSTEDFTKLPHFVSEMPPDFISRLWKIATQSFYDKIFDRTFEYYWQLFAKFCVLLPEDEKRRHIEWLYDMLIVSPALICRHTQILDAFYALYISTQSLDMHDQSRAFQRLFRLASTDVVDLKKNQGNLAFTFLMMRVYRDHMLTTDIAINLAQMQLAFVDKIIETPKLLTVSSVAKLHEGLLLEPLLRFPPSEIFSLELLDELEKLTQRCNRLKDVVQEDVAYSGRLKGILLVCFLRCFENSRVFQMLKCDLGFGWHLKVVEKHLIYASWDEDSLISKEIYNAYTSLVKYVTPMDGVSDLRRFLQKHKQRFEDIKPIKFGRPTCPSCCENIADLLSDIVVRNEAAGVQDCGEG